MKNFNKYLLIAVASLLVFASCKKVADLPYYTEGKAVTLSADRTTLAPTAADSSRNIITFSWNAGPGRARRIAERPFVSGLHRKLLAHPNGGALACIGHLERAWSLSIPTTGAMNRLGVFRSAMEVLMKGLPVGAALELFGARYAQLGADMSALLADLEHAGPDDLAVARADLVHRWTAHNDARDYVITGDPAVRLRFAASDP